ncbi:tRNA pseudouridine synthase A [Gardnerella vaginalis]|uniref:tRNA pseudouridine synthase A n=1 Tax=Gardnerella vaginalis TaxID=2702 RepID=UPI00035479C4|nr:tRNA pseudouridine synthase A [Gardnerella vaginalis]EPI42332.1 tRNA pseudouridine synthase A [Gardnerella vaginalis JCP8481A]EPI43535.1 tRNA pseudouridine synthase A [Gardnerella vaginalis JCP8481B]
MRLRLDLAYDGGGFYGWAKQPVLRTVQGEIESALHTVLRVPEGEVAEPLRLTVAGRTDTGVHASHQVCHLDVSEGILNRCIGHTELDGVSALEYRLRHVLPQDISLHSVSVAPYGFDARFSALERTYVYRISDGSCQSGHDPRMRGFVLKLDDVLDVEAMNKAARLMIGLHDFGSFARPNPGGTTIRKVIEARWERVGKSLEDARIEIGTGCVPPVEQGLIEFTIVADAFAHNMVRSLVNASVQIGCGKRSLDWFVEKIHTPLREGSTGPIASQGLTLEYVAYPPDDELATRAEQIRARRDSAELRLDDFELLNTQEATSIR